MAAPSPLAGNKMPMRKMPSSALTFASLGTDESGGAEGVVETGAALQAINTAPSTAIGKNDTRPSKVADRRVLISGKCRCVPVEGFGTAVRGWAGERISATACRCSRGRFGPVACGLRDEHGSSSWVSAFRSVVGRCAPDGAIRCTGRTARDERIVGHRCRCAAQQSAQCLAGRCPLPHLGAARCRCHAAAARRLLIAVVP